ncbi:ATP-grasp fold amidoligase family protein [Yeosuana marina]|uniref:ATP-grasp fold amidoligase family protein n=1 Tax=Yeosuana marina TaxID=1565536 RepID=UPI0030EF10D1
MKSFLRYIAKVILAKVNPEYYVKSSFKTNLNYTPNFKNPKTHNERMAKRRFCYTDKMTRLSDKIEVRKHVSEVIGEDYLVPMFFEMDSLTKNSYNKLPSSFVIKANHGSGFNLIVKDKSKYSYDELKKITDKWLNTKYHLIGLELHYKNIKPRLLVEQLLLDEEDKIPKDYKFYSFKNKIYLGLFTDRFTDNKVAFFNENWESIACPFVLSSNFKEISNPTTIKKPDNFNEMIDVVKKLSQSFDYVRIDLYTLNNKIYFGEYTFTPGGGILKFKTYSEDVEWGTYWS